MLFLVEYVGGVVYVRGCGVHGLPYVGGCGVAFNYVLEVLFISWCVLYVVEAWKCVYVRGCCLCRGCVVYVRECCLCRGCCLC